MGHSPRPSPVGPSTSSTPSSSPPPADSEDWEEDWEWELVPSPSTPKKQGTQVLDNAFEVAAIPGSFLSSAIQQQQQQQQQQRARPTNIIMPSWKDEYLSSLMEAERSNPVNFELVEACSHLNDRVAALEAEKAQWQLTSSQPPSSAGPSSADPSTAAASAAADPRLRRDLAQALSQKNALEARLRATAAERDRLLAASRSHSRAVAALAQERDALRLRVRDQAEELRGKKAMLDAVQDDVLALETSLTLVEKQKAKLAADNRDLVERWMRRARLEAEQMNAANERGVPDGAPS